MRFLAKQFDKRIGALNVLIELSGADYLEVANKIVTNNEFQRKRVKSSGTVYNLLKDDILKGCIIPPLVLATTSLIDFDEDNFDKSISEIFKSFNKLIILDGLQRTHLLIDISRQYPSFDLSKLTLRVEIYIALNDASVLYRMLTLNTGQTPMSLRHQIEILYHHYLIDGIGDIKIIRQIDDLAKQEIHEYNFSDLVEGYNSYIERTELALDRFNLLDTVKSIEKLSEEENRGDDFSSFAELYHALILKIQEISCDWEYPKEPDEEVPLAYSLDGSPFGRLPYKIFNKSQAITGFGSAIGRLIDFEIINNFGEVKEMIDSISIEESPDVFFLTILKRLDEIRNESKKIGNSQRLFFHHFFRGLFDKNNDCHCDLLSSVEYGYNRYRSLS